MKDQLVQLLEGRRGHFELESGYHGEWRFDLDSLFARSELLRPFVSELARRLAQYQLNAVCGPMTGGATLARLIAEELGVPYHFSERVVQPAATGLFPVRYVIPEAQRDSLNGKTISIVDDAVSAGSAVRGTFADLIACGARPVVVGALFAFGDAGFRFAADNAMGFEAIAIMPLRIWRPDECPHCRTGTPVEKV
jgi:orotate phosphoribosyltransferase